MLTTSFVSIPRGIQIQNNTPGTLIVTAYGVNMQEIGVVPIQSGTIVTLATSIPRLVLVISPAGTSTDVVNAVVNTGNRMIVTGNDC